MKIGFFSGLGLIFIVLKLTETVAWSWWVVLAPLYVPFILAIILVVFLVAMGYKPKLRFDKKD